jgi:hypothetical protein
MVSHFSTGRIFMTLLSIDISWTCTLPATSADPPIRRSGALPLFSMVR